uniref:TNFR-Cys domain-containing protein n=1 Tax=Paramormyrops kingsleyae TaxID=1676925 RepID=A0A3B3SWU3_9TELE
STFNDQPNDLEQCSPCTVCDGGNISVQACTPSSDTVCGVLEGHYCIIPYKGGCRAAHKHTACKPGQFIKQPGLYGFLILIIYCCPMCHPGTRVYRHCKAWTSTSCAPCIGSTFNDQPSGLEVCSPCTVCDGVRACTPSSDTVCGVLEGHYCINPYKGGCRAANKHTACKPGQFITQPGTEYTDTVCEDCSDNSYSDGSFTNCKPHTDCESRGLVTVKAGDQAADSECGEKNDTALTAGISVGVIAVIIMAAATYLLYKRQILYCKYYISSYENS